MPVAKSLTTSAFEPLRRYELLPPTKAPTYWDIGRAAVEQENDIYAIYKMNQEQAYPMQDGFDLVTAAKERGVEARDYTEVLSEAELDARIAKRRREEDNKQILESAGWTGYLAMMGAGMVSPTTFIPFMRGASGVRSIAAGAASIVSGAAAQEALLYASQETRTKGEVGFSLAASTVIGGLLGAAAHTMSKSVVDKIAHDMVNSPKEPTIHPPMPIGGDDLSAKANDSVLKDVGKLKRGWGADKLAFMSPITRGFEQWNAPSYIKELGGSVQLRKMTGGFSQAGLSLQDNAKFKAAVAGGNVEDLKRGYGVVSYIGRKTVDDAYIEYILGTKARGFGKKQRAILAGVRADGKLNYNEFKRQITLDIWSNFTRDGVDPHVRKAAKTLDEKVYKKMYDEAVEAGVLTGEEKVVGDQNYANRVYNNEVIMRRYNEFVDILTRNLSSKYDEDFAKEFDKLRERMLKDKKTLDDINRPLEEVIALREKIKADAQQLEQQTSLDVLEGMDSLKGIKNEIRALTRELDDLNKTKVDGADVEGLRRRMDRKAEIEAAIKAKAIQSEGIKKALGEGLENYTKALSEVRRRLAGLSQASALKDQRLARKLEKIERNEDDQIATILRANKQLQKFLKMLDSVSDDKLDATLSKWKTEFEKNSQKLTKLEEKRFELEKAGEFDAEGPDDSNPPPPPKTPDTPPTDSSPEVKTKTEEEIAAENKKLDDIVDSNIDQAVDQVKLYDNLANSFDSHWDNVADTLKEQGLLDDRTIKYAEERFFKKRNAILEADKIAKENELKAKAEADAKAKAAEEKAKFEAEKALYVKPLPELGGLSRRDLADMGIKPKMMQLIIDDPQKYADIIKKGKEGYFLDTYGTYRQAIESDVRVAEQRLNATKKIVDEYEQKIIAAFANKDPNTPIANLFTPGTIAMTWDEAFTRLDDIVSREVEKLDAIKRVHEKAKLHPKTQIPVGPTSPPSKTALPTEIKVAPYTKDDIRLNPDFKTASINWKTANEAVDWYIKNGSPEYKALAKHLKGKMDNASFYIFDDNGTDPKFASARQRLKNNKWAAFYTINFDPAQKAYRTGVYIGTEHGWTQETVLHELVHAALFTRIYYGNNIANKNTKLGKLVKELGDLQKAVEDHYAKDLNKPKGSIAHDIKYSFSNIQEVQTMALTNPGTMNYYRTIKYKGKTVYREFVRIMREILGIPKEEESAFVKVLDITARMLAEKNPEKSIPQFPVGAVVEFEPDSRFVGMIADQSESVDYGPKLKKEPPQHAGVLGEDPAMKLEDRMEKIISKMDDLAEKIDNLENFDRDAFRAEVEDMMWELSDVHAKINAKRAVRNEKLWKDVEKLSPEARQKRIDALKMKAADRPKDFISKWQTKAEGPLIQGLDEFQSTENLMKGEANFNKYARDIAEQTVTKILGTERRLAYSDIIQAERGPELARTLNIPSEQIADFLETDIEKLISVYTRTMGSDIAIARVFGSADAAEAFQKLSDEQKLMLAKIETLTKKDGTPLSKEEKEQLSYDTHKFYEQGRKDLMVLMERAKGVRGLPKDPDSASARMAKVAMDLNYLRFMGGVVVNSVADLARPIMKYGLTRTFRDGIIPMIRAFKTIRMSQREARLAGTALDMVMHTRAHAMMDIFDDAYRGTMAEKGIHFLSTRMGAIALFDQWTAAMKEFTAGIANAKLLDAIAIVNGEKATAKEIAKAQEFLARNNIDAEIAVTIWREVTNGKGGGKVNGVWLPNTESWNIADPQVARAQRAYRAALGGEVDSTIITPGFERPNWVDSSVPARMLAQFKAFGLSSVQKTIMAGLQEHDAAFMNGVVASLGLGMLSYYLWATAAGGDAQAKMQKSIAEGDWGVWADEAIARSGLLGVFADAQKYAHRVPVLRDYTSFSGGDTTRRAGGDLTETVLGPSFDLLEKAHGLITGIDEPTKQTLHLARQLLPFQNVFYLRQGLDKIEQSINLPEKRTQ